MKIETVPGCEGAYVITFGETISGAEWDQYLAFCRERIRSGRPFALLHDHRAGGAPNAVQRSQLSEMLGSEPRVGELVRASAIVSNSMLVRGALTAVTWIRPLPYPVRVFATVEEARTWCVAAMRSASHATP